VTPASHGDILGAPFAGPALHVMTRRMSAVTPHKHEASMALAALCQQSDRRNGLQPQPANQYLGKVKIKPPPKNKDASFPDLLHAMVTEMNVTAPHVLQWVHDGEAFAIHDPEVSVPVMLFSSLLFAAQPSHTTLARCTSTRVLNWQTSCKSTSSTATAPRYVDS